MCDPYVLAPYIIDIGDMGASAHAQWEPRHKSATTEQISMKIGFVCPYVFLMCPYICVIYVSLLCRGYTAMGRQRKIK